MEQVIAEAIWIDKKSSTLNDHIIRNRNMFLIIKILTNTVTDH